VVDRSIAHKHRMLRKVRQLFDRFAGACILALSHLIESFAQVANDMELIEQNGALRCMSIGGVAKWLHMPITASLLLAKPLITLGHTRFKATVAA